MDARSIQVTLRSLAVKAFGPNLSRKGIPRIASDTGLTVATVRSYFYGRPPTEGFLRKVSSLYGWNIAEEYATTSPLPRMLLGEVQRIVSYAKDLEDALEAADGYTAKHLHSKLVWRFYDIFLAMGFLSECTANINLSAVFAGVNNVVLDGVLHTRGNSAVYTVAQQNGSKKSYKLNNESQVSKLFQVLWGSAITN